MPIRVLDAATVGKIAAGEVVERPSSVVKELIENSLDAGATSVTVEIREGGIDYLRVTDNGCGIEPGQVRMAFENHATSKIVSADNLHDVRTLGFRGEALPSIAAVAKVEMTTRARGGEYGVRFSVEGGQNVSIKEIGCPEGTTVIMKDLFFNLPVRRSFLKKPKYEAGLIADCVAKMILGNPGVAFKFVSNGRTIYHSFGDGKLLHAVFAVYTRETAESMIEIDCFEGGMRIFGCIGVGEQAKSSRAHQSFFINGRSVRCALLSQSLEAACKERVTIGMYPMCALHLVLPPASVDVNVHPNKLEVRFRDELATKIAVESMLRSAFETRSMLDIPSAEGPLSRVGHVVITPVELPREENVPRTAEKTTRENAKDALAKQTEVDIKQTKTDTIQTEVSYAAPAYADKPAVKAPTEAPVVRTAFAEALAKAREALDQKASVSGTSSPAVQEDEGGAEKQMAAVQKAYVQPEIAINPAVSSKPSITMPASPEMPVNPSSDVRTETLLPQKNEQEMPEYRVIGTLLKTYILLEMQDSLILVDQHAAHERLQYEKLKAALEGETASQQLLTPLVMRLSSREMAIVEDHLDALSEAGYDVELFGETDIKVCSVPMIFGQADPKPQILSAVQALASSGGLSLDMRREKILQTACKSAVKAGDTLSESEIAALLKDMLTTGAPPTCPHGRPVFKRLTRRDIEKMFKRIQ